MKAIIMLRIVGLFVFFLYSVRGYAQTCYNYGGEVRILVAYTDDVANDYPSSSILETLIQPSIDNMNLAFENSGINHSVRLVRAVQIDYNETNDLAQSRDDFKNGNYGFSSISNLRYVYHADICVLITKNGQYAGIAAGVGVSRDNAYAAIKSAGMVSSYSMAHEIGHLYGCRHETVLDTANTPYAYGHGYVIPDLNDAQGYKVHTIMAYGTHSSHNDGVLTSPIPYFSNPNKTYQSKPLGTPGTEDASRVMDEGYTTIKGTILSENINITQNETIKKNEFADINTDNLIEMNTGTSYILEDGSKAIFRIDDGSGSIKFKDGFHAKAGSTMKAYLYDCSVSSKAAPEGGKVVANIENEDKTALKSDINSLKVYPNPTKEKLYLESINDMVNWKLTNYLGSSLEYSNIINNNDSKKMLIDMNKLPTGVYFLQVMFRNEQVVRKTVIKK